MESQATPVVLFLADISGYTRFMLSHERALSHSQMIIGGLMETLMEQIDHPLKISQLEGDALFMYVVKTGDPSTWQRRSRHLVERILRLFQTFKQRQAALGAYSICRCEACSHIDHLNLKVVAHSGEALLTQVGQYPVLSGPGVIAVHRLLKNSLAGDQYVLMTDAARRDLRFCEDKSLVEGVEEYDVGTFRTYAYFPEVAIDSNAEAIRGPVSDSNVAVKILRHEIQRDDRGRRRSLSGFPLQHRTCGGGDLRVRPGMV